MLIALTACTNQHAAEDQFLRCKGSIVLVVTNADPVTEDNQEIAVHIKSSTISFSGNAAMFEGQIPICSPASGGNARDEAFFSFDTALCNPSGVDLRYRTYGTFNRVLSKLTLTNESLGADVPIRGTFTCAKIDATT